MALRTIQRFDAWDEGGSRFILRELAEVAVDPDGVEHQMGKSMFKTINGHSVQLGCGPGEFYIPCFFRHLSTNRSLR